MDIERGKREKEREKGERERERERGERGRERDRKRGWGRERRADQEREREGERALRAERCFVSVSLYSVFRIQMRPQAHGRPSEDAMDSFCRVCCTCFRPRLIDDDRCRSPAA